MRIPARFAEHVAAGDLASYSFIEPNYHNLGVNNSQPSALRDEAGCYLVFRLPGLLVPVDRGIQAQCAIGHDGHAIVLPGDHRPAPHRCSAR
jgi:hypothetical protein